MQTIANSIIAFEYGCVTFAIADIAYRCIKRSFARLVTTVSVSGLFVFLSCGAHHFASAWLSAEWQSALTVIDAIGSVPLAVFWLFGRNVIWEKISLNLDAYHNYKSLQASYDASPGGLVELQWESVGDFRFTRCNRAGNKIIQDIGGPDNIVGCLMCATVPGHREPIATEGGLSAYEIYRRVAFNVRPFESGEREAVLPLNVSGKETRYYQQNVVQMEPGLLTIGFTEITERYELIERLKQQAITDQLTGLYTRAYIFNALDSAILKCRRGACWCYARIDLDNFGQINKAYGHQAGDKAIIWAANEIRSCVRDEDVCARMGGDEFAILIHGDINNGKRIAEQIREKLARPFLIGDIPFHVTASIGVVEIVE